MPVYYSGSSTVSVPISDNYRIAALQAGAGQQVWANRNITYSFLERGSWFANEYGNGAELTAGWIPLTTAQREAVREALTAWSSVANITFTEVADSSSTVGDMRFGFTSAVPAPYTAYAYMPTEAAEGGDVWISSALANQNFTTGTSYGEVAPADLWVRADAMNYMLLLHEIGHALGLSHPFASAGQTRSTAPLPVYEDRQSNTVMSYSGPHDGGVPTTPMQYDIAAIQHLYGANTTYHAGNDTYYYDIAAINYSTLWDAGGIDTLVITNDRSVTAEYMNSPAAVIADLRGGHIRVGFSSDARAQLAGGIPGYPSPSYGDTGRVMLANGVVIENVKTTGLRDWIYGNDANNVIDSGDGGDIVDGGAGIDTSVYSRTKSHYTLEIRVYENPAGIAPVASPYSVTDNFVSPSYGGAAPSRKVDTLTTIERLQFADVGLAYDLNGNAGTTAKFISAVFGQEALANRNYVGIGLDFLDGGTSHQALMEIALTAKLGVGASNAAVVDLLYTNLIGSPTPAGAMAYYKGLLDAGYISQAGLGVSAADMPYNLANVDFVGLAATGLEYA